MAKRIRFNTGAVNKLTAMSMKESIRKRLRRLGVKYIECVQLPYEIEMSEHEYVMFCLQWQAELPYQEWRVIERGWESLSPEKTPYKIKNFLRKFSREVLRVEGQVAVVHRVRARIEKGPAG